MNEVKYLEQLRNRLFSKENHRKIALTKEWLSGVPPMPGVYVVFSGADTVYVGETGNLRKRMRDLCDSRHHTLRRSIGHKFYSDVKGYCQASTKEKFPDHIETLINTHICRKYTISFLPVSLGRKELEEFIESSMDIYTRLNKRGKRK